VSESVASCSWRSNQPLRRSAPSLPNDEADQACVAI
jgi:hypothetical protein